MDTTKYKGNRAIAVILLSMLILCLVPQTAYASSHRLRVRGPEDYGYDRIYYDPQAEGLPEAFSQHNRNVLLFSDSVTGKAVYCIDIYNHSLNAGAYYSETDSPERLSQEQQLLLSAVLAYGETVPGNDPYRQAATQLAVWLITTGEYSDNAAVHAVAYGFAPAVEYNEEEDYIGKQVEDILSYAHRANRVPSFAEDTVKLYWDDEKECFYASLTDSIGVLSQFNCETSSNDEVTFHQHGDTLEIFSAEDTLSEECFTFEKTAYGTASALYLAKEGDQDLVEYDTFTTVTFDIRILTADTPVIICKSAEDGIISNITFEISGEDSVYTVTTDDDGKAYIELGSGEYTVKEMNVPDRYISPKEQRITVEKRTSSLTVHFINELKGTITVNKSSEDGVISGACFLVENIKTGESFIMKTGSDGTAISGYLPFGVYRITEQDVPDRYVLPESVTVTVTEDDKNITVYFENNLKKVRIFVTKCSAYTDAMHSCGITDRPLAGAVYGIFLNGSLIETLVTDETGCAASGEIAYTEEGSYYLKEIKAPEGFLADDTSYPFTVTGEEPVLSFTLRDAPAVGLMRVSCDRPLTDDAPQTGDDTLICLWAALSVISLFGLVILISNRRRFIQ